MSGPKCESKISASLPYVKHRDARRVTCGKIDSHIHRIDMALRISWRAFFVQRSLCILIDGFVFRGTAGNSASQFSRLLTNWALSSTGGTPLVCFVLHTGDRSGLSAIAHFCTVERAGMLWRTQEREGMAIGLTPLQSSEESTLSRAPLLSYPVPCHRNSQRGTSEPLILPSTIRSSLLKRRVHAGNTEKRVVLTDSFYCVKSGGAGGIRTHEWRFCRPLPWATWVPRQTSKYSKIFASARKLAARSARTPRYFFAGATGEAILASRRKRADSSGGVGLM